MLSLKRNANNNFFDLILLIFELVKHFQNLNVS